MGTAGTVVVVVVVVVGAKWQIGNDEWARGSWRARYVPFLASVEIRTSPVWRLHQRAAIWGRKLTGCGEYQ